MNIKSGVVFALNLILIIGIVSFLLEAPIIKSINSYDITSYCEPERNSARNGLAWGE